MERFSFIFLVAGIGFFVLAFLVSGYAPYMQFQGLQVVSIQELAARPPLDFVELREQYPEAFAKAFPGKSDSEAFAEALVLGKASYVGEACWHCHSQQVRAVGGDEARFGRISYPEEYNNELNYPPMWGTRRIGPDLAREAGRRSNDWHVAHFWNPRHVAPLSVMPSYPWFFESDGKTPNKTGLSVIAYMQWLGSWEHTRTETVYAAGDIERGYPAPVIDRPANPNAAPAASGDTPSEGKKDQPKKEEDY